MSSFQKKRAPKAVSIPGTLPSLHNSQLLLSTGVPSFDHLLGGGLPVGTILLIEEDTYNVYCKLLTRLFLSEGIVHKHYSHVSSLDENVNAIVNDLPSKCEVEKSDITAQLEEKMKIAWQYQQYKANPQTSKSRFDHAFDLSKKIDLTDDDKENMVLFDASRTENIFSELLEDIKETISKHNLVPKKGGAESNLLRIVISSCLSPLWGEMYAQDDGCNDWAKITSFLTLLKATVRNSFSSVLITIPSHLIADPALLHRIYGIVDFAVKLESFQGSEKETNPLFKDFHGIFHVNKLAAINTLLTPQINLSDWAFHLKRKNFVIERLHLPPELQDTKARSEEDVIKPIDKGGCMGSKLPSNIDF